MIKTADGPVKKNLGMINIPLAGENTTHSSGSSGDAEVLTPLKDKKLEVSGTGNSDKVSGDKAKNSTAAMVEYARYPVSRTELFQVSSDCTTFSSSSNSSD